MSQLTAGSVEVEVRANLTKLVQGLSDGKAATERFDKAVGDKVNATAKKFDDAAAGVVKGEQAKQSAMKQTAEYTDASIEKTKAETAAIREQTAEMTRNWEAEKRRMIASGNYATNPDRAAVNSAATSIIGKYDPAAAAAGRYAHELDQIQFLQKQGAISASQAERYTRAAAHAHEEAARSTKKFNLEEMHLGETAKLVGGLLTIFTIDKLFEAAKSGLEFAASIKTQAQQLGITTKQLQEYHYAAQQSGISTSDMDMGIRMLGKTLGEAASGSRRDAKVLALVGISLKDVKSGAVTAATALPKIADALKAIHNPAQQAAVLTQLFGETGQRLAPLLLEGAEGIKKLTDAANELGVVLDDKLINSADEAQKKIDALKTVLQADVSRTVAQNAAAIANLADTFLALASAIIKFMDTDPQTALGLLGAIVGYQLGGPVGAAIGLTGGVIMGDKAQQARIDSNADVKFRKQQLDAARNDLAARKGEKARPGEESYLGGLIKVHKDDSHASGATIAQAQAEVVRQERLYAGAVAKAAAKVTEKPGKTDPALQKKLDDLLAPKGRTGGRQSPANRFESDLANIEQDRLALEMQLTSDVQKSADLKKQQIDAELAQKKADLDRQVHSKALTKAEADTLKLKLDANAQTKKDIVDRDARQKIIDQQNALDQAIADAKVQELQEQEALSKTADERRKIELQIVAESFKQRAKALQATIDSTTSSDAEKEQARLNLEILTSLQKYAKIKALQATQGPLESYLASQPHTEAQFNEARQNVDVRRYQEVNQRTVQFADDLAGAFSSAAGALARFEDPLKVATSLLSDMAQMFTREFIEKPIFDWMREKFAAPLSEKLISGKTLDGTVIKGAADPTGLHAAELGTAAGISAKQLDLFTAALERSIATLNSGAGGGLSAGSHDLFKTLNPYGSFASDTQADPGALVDYGGKMTGIGDKAIQLDTNFTDLTGSTDELMKSVTGTGSALRDFETALTSFSMMSPGSGGGGSGLLGSLLSIGGSLLGGSFSAGLPKIGASVLGQGSIFNSVPVADISAGLPHFARGGRVQGEGTGSSDSITAKIGNGEFLVNADATSRFLPVLTAINQGRMPSMAAVEGLSAKMGSGGRGGSSYHFGDIVLPGITDERSGRRTGRQIGAEIQREIRRSLRSGYNAS